MKMYYENVLNFLNKQVDNYEALINTACKNSKLYYNLINRKSAIIQLRNDFISTFEDYKYIKSLEEKKPVKNLTILNIYDCIDIISDHIILKKSVYYDDILLIYYDSFFIGMCRVIQHKYFKPSLWYFIEYNEITKSDIEFYNECFIKYFDTFNVKSLYDIMRDVTSQNTRDFIIYTNKFKEVN